MNGNYDNTNRGALFKNEDKQGDSHPDYKGSLNVEGTDLWVSAWIKTSKAGVKYMSLSVKQKDAPKRTQQARTREPERDEFDDDIPF